MRKICQYRVAELSFRIIFEQDTNDDTLLPSYKPFEQEVDDESVMFVLTVDDTFKPESRGEEIRQVDCGGNMHGVYATPNGGYRFYVSDLKNRECCILDTNSDFSVAVVALKGDEGMRTFGLNDSLMMLFAFASAGHDALLMHSSVIRKDGYGFMFLGVSGTGKSTHTANWQRYIADCDLMNDDNPVVRIVDGVVKIFGSPWSGKTPCYRNISAPVAGMVMLRQAKENRIRRMSIPEAFAAIHSSCSLMRWDKRSYMQVCDNISRILERIGIYLMYNLPDEEAVNLSYSTLRK